MAPGVRPKNCPTGNTFQSTVISTNQNNVDINSGIDTQMLNQLIATRVAEALVAAVVTHAPKLILLFPEMVPNPDWLLERYIEGLPLNIKGNVTSSKPVDLHKAIEMAQGLMYQVVQELGENSGHKAKDCQAPPRPVSQREPESQGGQGSDVTCFGCGEKGHESIWILFKGLSGHLGSFDPVDKYHSADAVPKDHLRRFHGMDDAKEIWAAIKTRFGGNANSKKMQKAVLKQQFEAFTISSKESLEKGYDRFQKLLSQLDALGAGVSDEDANHKFLRSLPPAWDSLAMTMRTKKNIDTLSIDDLYNNLSVFEQDIQKTSSSSLSSDNVAFLSQAKASSSKHKPSHSSGSYSSYTFLSLGSIDDMDLEEMDINWQIAMTAIKIKKFYKKTGRRPRVDGKMHVAFDKRKVKCFNCHNTGVILPGEAVKGSKEGGRQEASRGQDFKPVRMKRKLFDDIDEGQIIWVRARREDQGKEPNSYNALKAMYDELHLNLYDGELGAVSDASSTHYSTCQSNDNDGELGTVSKTNQSMITLFRILLLSSVHGSSTEAYDENRGLLIDVDGIITDFNNLHMRLMFTTNPLRILNAHPQSQNLGDPNTTVQDIEAISQKITEAHALKSSEALRWKLGESYAGRTVAVQLQQVMGFWLHLPMVPKGDSFDAKKISNEFHGRNYIFLGPKIYKSQQNKGGIFISQASKSKDFSSQCCSRGSSSISRGKPLLGLWFLGNIPPFIGNAFSDMTMVCSNLTGNPQQVLLGVGKGDAGSTWTWKRTCQLSLANWMQIGLDFLRSLKLRYALTNNPPIYDSLVKQFWQTATARTLADGTQQLKSKP
ncbi:hypothetical protein Tco_0940888 [Tanacetum coccineum]|uniref:Uncharacterized protein n=1 Tax=Tanacetum coccineum TaxID=301880 RepID=A0ABQ5DRU5_9ASTR